VLLDKFDRFGRTFGDINVSIDRLFYLFMNINKDSSPSDYKFKCKLKIKNLF
jgi:hypothetical protein